MNDPEMRVPLLAIPYTLHYECCAFLHVLDMGNLFVSCRRLAIYGQLVDDDAQANRFALTYEIALIRQWRRVPVAYFDGLRLRHTW